MKIKTSELTRHALNWAVAMCQGDKVFRPRLGRPGDWDKEAYLADGSDDRWVVRVQNPTVARFVDWTYNPSGDWMQGGPIIEREGITVVCWAMRPGPDWMARLWLELNGRASVTFTGSTPLIAAMRCYVASKLGDEVEIPEELK
jgi:hypothetical protein